MVFVETPIFTARLGEVLAEDQYRLLQVKLAGNPALGHLIPGGRGLRKLRWGAGGKGKSGGVRIIYYWISQEHQIFMIYAFKKSEQEDLTKEQLDELAKFVKKGLS